jgi:hypothetical protein
VSSGPAASSEWRAIVLGLCVAFVVGVVLWLIGVEAFTASILGTFVGIGTAVAWQRLLASRQIR